MAKSVSLATFFNPEAAFKWVRSFETRLAKTSKGRCGRPRKTPVGQKKAIREKLQPVAKRLRRDGLSLRQIAKELKKPLSTVAGWLRTENDFS